MAATAQITSVTKRAITNFLHGLETENVLGYGFSYMSIEHLCDFKSRFSKADIEMRCVTARSDFYRHAGRVAEKALDLFSETIEKLKKARDTGSYDPEKYPELHALFEYLEEVREAEFKFETEPEGSGRARATSHADAEKISKIEKAIEKQFGNGSEYETISVLVTHILNKLIPPTRNSEIDGHFKKQRAELAASGVEDGYCLCFCGCGERINVGDTGIGNKLVFHGRVDAFIDPVAVTADRGDDVNLEDHPDTTIATDTESSEGEPSPKRFRQSEEVFRDVEIWASTTFEVEASDLPCDVQNVLSVASSSSHVTVGQTSISQATAVCIVNACHQHYRNETSCKETQLIPNILMSKNSFSVFLYNPKHDILLRNQRIQFRSSERKNYHVFAIIYLWCVLNGTITVPAAVVGDESYKSGFHVKSSNFGIYKNSLFRGKEYADKEDEFNRKKDYDIGSADGLVDQIPMNWIDRELVGTEETYYIAKVNPI